MNVSITSIPETTVTRKWQVTIPAKIRDHFGIKPRAKIRFTIEEDGTAIRLTPAPSQARATFGVVTPHHNPEDFQTIRQAFMQGVATAVQNKNNLCDCGLSIRMSSFATSLAMTK